MVEDVGRIVRWEAEGVKVECQFRVIRVFYPDQPPEVVQKYVEFREEGADICACSRQNL